MDETHRSGVVDHVVVTASDLDEGIAWVESLTGVRAASGGRHPAWGTRNALLSLGEGCYLEIIAPDPQRPIGREPRIFGLDRVRSPRLAAWALRVGDIDDASRRAAAAGYDPGTIVAGQRERQDGSLLTWRLTDPGAMPVDGTLPFLIQWGKEHPAHTAPGGCRLIELRVFTPDPAPANEMLRAISAEFRVRKADSHHLEASILTPAGPVILR